MHWQKKIFFALWATFVLYVLVELYRPGSITGQFHLLFFGLLTLFYAIWLAVSERSAPGGNYLVVVPMVLIGGILLWQPYVLDWSRILLVLVFFVTSTIVLKAKR